MTPIMSDAGLSNVELKAVVLTMEKIKVSVEGIGNNARGESFAYQDLP